MHILCAEARAHDLRSGPELQASSEEKAFLLKQTSEVKGKKIQEEEARRATLSP